MSNDNDNDNIAVIYDTDNYLEYKLSKADKDTYMECIFENCSDYTIKGEYKGNRFEARDRELEKYIETWKKIRKDYTQEELDNETSKATEVLTEEYPPVPDLTEDELKEMYDELEEEHLQDDLNFYQERDYECEMEMLESVSIATKASSRIILNVAGTRWNGTYDNWRTFPDGDNCDNMAELIRQVMRAGCRHLEDFRIEADLDDGCISISGTHHDTNCGPRDRIDIYVLDTSEIPDDSYDAVYKYCEEHNLDYKELTEEEFNNIEALLYDKYDLVTWSDVDNNNMLDKVMDKHKKNLASLVFALYGTKDKDGNEVKKDEFFV